MTPQSIIKVKSMQIGSHALFWFVVLLFYTYFFGFSSSNFEYVLAFSLFLMPITIGTTYVFIYNLIPKYLLKGSRSLFALYSIYAIIISFYLIFISIYFGLVYLADFRTTIMAPISRSPLFIAIAIYLIVFIVASFKILRLYLFQAKTKKELENKMLNTRLKLKEQELSYLKMQIHPHFLFNTLNTLYGLALKKSDNTPEVVIRLSNLLSYLLYETDKPFVELTEEIKHIKDYIAIEKLRFGPKLNVQFETVNIISMTKIAPMLLLPFVENSFKHGISVDGTLKVFFKLTCNEGKIIFEARNSCKSEELATGIGLSNIKKRLKLLYPDKYQLRITSEDQFFKVFLEINKL